jgi:hypothetical protein
MPLISAVSLSMVPVPWALIVGDPRRLDAGILQGKLCGNQRHVRKDIYLF